MKVEIGNIVSVHYKGTLDDGTEFDSSYTRGEPITFQVGAGQMIAGFDSALPGMAVGETKSIVIVPSEGYGEVNPEAIQTVSRENFPENFEAQVGESVSGRDPSSGQEFRATIAEVQADNIVLDFNHPMAGKNMNFDIQLTEITHQK